MLLGPRDDWADAKPADPAGEGQLLQPSGSRRQDCTHCTPWPRSLPGISSVLFAFDIDGSLQRVSGFLAVVIWLLLLPPPPRCPVSKHDQRHTGRLRKRRNLLTGEGVGGEREAWSSKYHSIRYSLVPTVFKYFVCKILDEETFWQYWL